MASHKSEQGKQQQGQQKQGQEKQQQGLQRRGGGELGGYGWGNDLSPFTMMRRMFEDMDRLFDDFGLGFGSYGRGYEAGGFEGLWSPQIDVARRGDHLVIKADLPGMKEDDVHVEVEEGVLTISGERKQEHEEERGGVYRSERSYGSFRREIGLPEGVDLENAKASFKDGVLEVSLKLPEEKKTGARKIPIGGAEREKPAEVGGEKHASEKSPEPVEGAPELKSIH